MPYGTADSDAELDRYDRTDLLMYASDIVAPTPATEVVVATADRLERHALKKCRTKGELKAMLDAMRQAHRNRPGGPNHPRAETYLGDVERFLKDVDALYAYLSR